MTTTNVVFELPDKKAFKTVLLFSYLSVSRLINNKLENCIM
jgi:hypothetical protein